MANYKLAAMYAFAGQPKQSEYWIVVMTRMNRPDERVVRDLRRQWDEQATAYPPMAIVEWPEEAGYAPPRKNEKSPTDTANNWIYTGFLIYFCF